MHACMSYIIDLPLRIPEELPLLLLHDLYRISPQAEQEDIFNRWHVCYHGTDSSHICDIVKCGQLLKPGILYTMLK